MTFQIQKFVTRVRMSEAKGERNLMVSLQDAKELSAELTLLLLQMEDLRKLKLDTAETKDTGEVSWSGGSFKDA